MQMVMPLLKSQIPPAEVVRKAYEEAHEPLLLLDVVKPPVAGRRDSPETLNSSAQQAALEQLRRVAFEADIPTGAFRVATSLHTSIPQAIVEEATARKVDAIVLGDTSPTGLGRLLPLRKDVAKEVSKQTDIPVKIVSSNGLVAA